MQIYINGVNITPYIAAKGVKWQRNDVDGPNAGRVLEDAHMERDRIATKMRLDITLTTLPYKTLNTILNIIAEEYVSVYYLDPQKGWRTSTFYSNNNPASFLLYNAGGDYNEDLYDSISFPLVEV